MNRSRTKQRVTLAAVARRAGVAESTASRVMNGYTRNFRVRPEVRQRVLDAARELDYKPNPMVRSIAAKRTNLVAAVGSPNDEQVRVAVRAAAERLLEERVHLCTAFVNPASQAMELPSWRIDGVLAVRATSLDELREYAADGTPCVSMDGPMLDDSDAVNPSAADTVQTAFEHLRETGHGHVVFACLELSAQALQETRTSYRFQAAYVELCKAQGLKPVFLELDKKAPRGRSVWDVLENLEAPGVMTQDALTSMRLIQQAADVGARIPDDYGMVCLRDAEVCSLSTPTITGIRLSQEELGMRAAELLLNRLNTSTDEPIEAQHVHVPGELVVRNSTGAVVSH